MVRCLVFLFALLVPLRVLAVSIPSTEVVVDIDLNGTFEKTLQQAIADGTLGGGPGGGGDITAVGPCLGPGDCFTSGVGANTFLAGPTSGAAGAAVIRSLVDADIPVTVLRSSQLDSWADFLIQTGVSGACTVSTAVFGNGSCGTIGIAQIDTAAIQRRVGGTCDGTGTNNAIGAVAADGSTTCRDLEEETHASEHASGGSDPVDHNTLQNYDPIRHRQVFVNATCTAQNGGVSGDLCIQGASIYCCPTSPGTCNGANWGLCGDGGGGGGNPSAPSGSIQFNNGGAFGGITGSSVDGSGNVTLGGSLTLLGPLDVTGSVNGRRGHDLRDNTVELLAPLNKTFWGECGLGGNDGDICIRRSAGAGEEKVVRAGSTAGGDLGGTYPSPTVANVQAGAVKEAEGDFTPATNDGSRHDHAGVDISTGTVHDDRIGGANEEDEIGTSTPTANRVPRSQGGSPFLSDGWVSGAAERDELFLDILVDPSGGIIQGIQNALKNCISPIPPLSSGQANSVGNCRIIMPEPTTYTISQADLDAGIMRKLSGAAINVCDCADDDDCFNSSDTAAECTNIHIIGHGATIKWNGNVGTVGGGGNPAWPALFEWNNLSNFLVEDLYIDGNDTCNATDACGCDNYGCASFVHLIGAYAKNGRFSGGSCEVAEDLSGSDNNNFHQWRCFQVQSAVCNTAAQTGVEGLILEKMRFELSSAGITEQAGGQRNCSTRGMVIRDNYFSWPNRTEPDAGPTKEQAVTCSTPCVVTGNTFDFKNSATSSTIAMMGVDLIHDSEFTYGQLKVIEGVGSGGLVANNQFLRMDQGAVGVRIIGHSNAIVANNRFEAGACSTTTTQSCSENSECPGGETCARIAPWAGITLFRLVNGNDQCIGANNPTWDTTPDNPYEGCCSGANAGTCGDFNAQKGNKIFGNVFSGSRMHAGGWLDNSATGAGAGAPIVFWDSNLTVDDATEGSGNEIFGNSFDIVDDAGVDDGFSSYNAASDADVAAYKARNMIGSNSVSFRDVGFAEHWDGHVRLGITPLENNGITSVLVRDTDGQVKTRTVASLGTAGYSTIQDDGAAETQRATLNLIGAGVDCVDNAGSTRTDCTITGGAAAALDDLSDAQITSPANGACLVKAADADCVGSGDPWGCCTGSGTGTCGSNWVDAQLNLADTDAVRGVLPDANIHDTHTHTDGSIAGADVADAGITYAKMQNIATDSLIGRDTAASGVPEEITLGASLSFDGNRVLRRAALTGDVTAAVNSNTTTIGANKVQYTMIQQLGANTLLGNPTGGTADVTEVSLSSTLEFNTGILRRAALTGDVTANAGSNATTIGADKVLTGMIAANAVQTSDISDNNVTPAKISLLNDVTHWGAGAFSADGTDCSNPAEVSIASGPKGWLADCNLGSTDTDGFLYGDAILNPDIDLASDATFNVSARMEVDGGAGTLHGLLEIQCRGTTEAPSSSWDDSENLDITTQTGDTPDDVLTGTTTAGGVELGGCTAGDTLYWRFKLCDQTDGSPSTGCTSTALNDDFKFERFWMTYKVNPQ